MKEKTYERSEEMEQLAREVIASDDRLAIRVGRWENRYDRTEIDLCIDCSILLDKFLRMEVTP